MKYKEWTSFFKHLEEASLKGHLSTVYALFGAGESDRNYIASKIFSYFTRGEKPITFFRFSAGETPYTKIHEQLITPSLFGDQALIFVDGIEKWKKEEIEELICYLAHPCFFSFLILGSSQAKLMQELYGKGKKEMIVLDLCQEKPWEKLQRLRAWSEVLLQHTPHKFSQDAIQFLMENVDPEMDALEMAIDKIVCFLPNKTYIQKADVQQLIVPKSHVINWQLAEELLFNPSRNALNIPKDISELIAVMGTLRYQVHVATKLSSLIRRGASVDEITQHLPTLRSTQLEKMLQKVKRIDLCFFFQIGAALCDLEALAKQSVLSASSLFTHFLLKLEHLKKQYHVA